VSVGVVVAVAVAVLLVLATLVIWARDNHREDTASHGDEPRTESERLYRSSDRPAGADADGEGPWSTATSRPPTPPSPTDLTPPTARRTAAPL